MQYIEPGARSPNSIATPVHYAVGSPTALQPMPRCLPGLCSLEPMMATATVPSVDRSLQQLNSAMQELMVTQFKQVKDKLDALSVVQETMKKEVTKVNDTVSVILERQHAQPLKYESEQKEAKQEDGSVLSSLGLDGSMVLNAPRQTRSTRRTSGIRKRPSVAAQRGNRDSASVPIIQDLVGLVSDVVQNCTVSQTLTHPHLGGSRCAYWTVFWSLSRRQKETVGDAFMGVIISVNAICIGIQMDSDHAFFEYIDVFFSIAFILELLTKLGMFGFHGQFCDRAHGAASNIFDACLIFIDLLQLVIKEALDVGSALENTPSASMFRLIRLVRLVRLLRILRLPIFHDLIAMMTGLIGGFSTLIWAIALFALIIYVVSLMFREFFGRNYSHNISRYFSTVPRSMFTVFRCAFGDCSAKGGVPIFEWVTDEFGAIFALIYCAFTFVVVVGLFNVISAIFVESTMAAAQKSEVAKKQERIADQHLWSTRVTTLLLVFMEYCGMAVEASNFDLDNDGKLDAAEKEMYKEAMKSMIDCEIGAEAFAEWVSDERVVQALKDLDINPDDNSYLFDILDCDNGGLVFVNEVIDGISRLRGEPRRSDIITIDLMVRQMQKDQMKTVKSIENLTYKLRLDTR